MLQSLTFLGTFDVMDIMSNTLGAVIGFVAYKVGFSPQITFKKLAASAVSVIILFIAIMVVSEAIDYGIHVNERLGPVIPLDVLSTSTPIVKDFSTFTVQGKTVKPQFNIFSSDEGTVKEYSYHLNKKNLRLYANFGIPDDEAYNGSVTIFINGEAFSQFNCDTEKDSQLYKMETFFDWNIEDIKIVVTGNAKVWDVGVAEMKHWWE